MISSVISAATSNDSISLVPLLLAVSKSKADRKLLECKIPLAPYALEILECVRQLALLAQNAAGTSK